MHRGVALHKDGDRQTVFLAKNDARLIALDSETGTPVLTSELEAKSI